MPHKKPSRYRGQHRKNIDPRTRYTVVVSTALVGAGVIAIGAGTALPQPQTHTANAALGVNSGTGGGSAQATQSPEVSSSPQLTGSAQAQHRDGAPIPEKLPEWVRPANGPVSSLFGPRWGVQHLGVDIAAPMGSPVKAAHEGVVKLADWNGGYGKLVIIDHGNGLTTYYGHNSELVVQAGQHVKAGDVIAKIGSTGQSTGPHCHFEVRINGEQINPLPFMQEKGVEL